MDDSLNAGSDNKLPLIISVVAVGAAVLALLFAFKAKNEANSLKDKLAETESVLRKEVEKAGAGSAKAADLAAEHEEFTQFKSAVVAKFEEVSRVVGEQNTVLRGLVAGKKPADTAKTPADAAKNPAGTKVVEAAAGEYKVKSGDTFAKIAKGNGTTIAALVAANPGVDSSKLKVGQIIKLPAKK